MEARVGIELEAFTRPVRQVRSASLAQGRLRTEPRAEIPSVAEGPAGNLEARVGIEPTHKGFADLPRAILPRF